MRTTRARDARRGRAHAALAVLGLALLAACGSRPASRPPTAPRTQPGDADAGAATPSGAGLARPPACGLDPETAAARAGEVAARGVVDLAVELIDCAVASTPSPELARRREELERAADPAGEAWSALLRRGVEAAARGDDVESRRLLARARRALLSGGGAYELGLPPAEGDRIDAFTLGGDRLFTANDYGAIHVWDRASGGFVARLRFGDGDFEWGTLVASDDGRWAAHGAPYAPTIDFADAETGARRTVQMNGTALAALRFCPSAATLLAVDETEAVVWDVASGQPLRRVVLDPAPGGEAGALSRDCSSFAAMAEPGEEDEGGVTVGVWSTETGALVQRLRDRRFELTVGLGLDFDFSPRGGLLAVGEGHRVLIWDVRTRRVRHFLDGHADVVHEVSFAPDSLTVAALTEGDEAAWGELVLWDVRHGTRRLRPIPFTDSAPSAVVFTPDARELLVAPFEARAIDVLDVRTGARRGRLGELTALLGPVAVTPAGLLAVVDDDGLLHRWPQRAAEPLPPIALAAPATALAVDGARLVASTARGTQLVDWATGQVSDALPADAGTLLAVGPGGRVATLDPGNGLAVFELATGRRLWSVRLAGSYEAAAFLDGDRLVHGNARPGAGGSGAVSQLLQVRDATSGRLLRELGLEQPPRAAVASPDGTTLAVSVGGAVKLFDATSLELERALTPPGPEWPVLARLAYSPDGALVADLAPRPAALRVWSVQTGALVYESGDTLAFGASLAFVDPVTVVISTETQLAIVDVAAGRELARIRRIAAGGWIAWTPDGAVDAVGEARQAVTTVVREPGGAAIEVSPLLGWDRFARPGLVARLGRPGP